MKRVLLVACILLAACGKRVADGQARIERAEDAQQSCWRVNDGWSATAWTCEKRQ